MVTMTQTNLFSWDAIDARSDHDRLQLVIDHLPDERLVQDLEVMRQQGRNSSGLTRSSRCLDGQTLGASGSLLWTLTLKGLTSVGNRAAVDATDSRSIQPPIALC